MKSTVGKVIWAAVITTLFLLVSIGVAGSESRAPSLSYNSWDIDATVQDNGDIKVKYLMDIRMRKRESDDGVKPWRQMYRDYTLSTNGGNAISDVSVRNVTTGETYKQTSATACSNPSSRYDWDATCAGTWYLADVSMGESHPRPYEPLELDADSDSQGNEGTIGGTTRNVELGWNIPSTTSTKSMVFEIEFTFENAVTQYQDVDLVQWSAFSDENSVPIGKLTVDVTLPEGATSDNSWAWLHYEGAQSTVNRTDNGRVLQSSAEDVRAGDYYDIVMMYTPSKRGLVRHRVDRSVRQSVIDQEDAKESSWRNRQHGKAVTTVTIWLLVVLVCGGLCVGAWISAIRQRQRTHYRGPIEYWRDLPQMSPAAAAKLCSVLAPEGKGSWDDKAMAATVMSLMSKGAIGVYPGQSARYRGIDMSRPDVVHLAQMLDSQGLGSDGFDTSTVVIMPAVFSDRARLALCASEDAALEMLLVASRRIGSPVFDLSQMNACFKGDENAYTLSSAFSSAALDEYRSLDAVRTAGAGARTMGVFAAVFAWLASIYFYLGDGNLALVLCVSAPLMFAGTLASLMAPRVVLTSPDQIYAGEVLGLKRYLEDYSDFSDRGVLDMVLWGRYMVYATAFGISDKALAQLARAYPQVLDPAWLDANAVGTSYFYWSMRPTSSRFRAVGGFSSGMDIRSFSANYADFGAQLHSSFSSISSTISAASPSSSSGGSHGSFSGGGGFGGGGGGIGGGGGGGR